MIPGLVQWVKGSGVSTATAWFAAVARFIPWPENFRMPQVWPKKKKKEFTRKIRKYFEINISEITIY